MLIFIESCNFLISASTMYISASAFHKNNARNNISNDVYSIGRYTRGQERFCILLKVPDPLRPLTNGIFSLCYSLLIKYQSSLSSFFILSFALLIINSIFPIFSKSTAKTVSFFSFSILITFPLPSNVCSI